MSYIRTNDGRIIDLERYEEKTSPITKAKGFIDLIDKNKVCDLEIFEKDIIAQADTIEELCDKRYWLIYWKDRKPELMSCWFAKWHWKNNKNLISRVCACIFTDKGLIYVAKMNEKGELELL